MNCSRGWWAVYTRHHNEQTVSQMLEAKGAEVFSATYQSTRRWKDRVKVLPMPLFPCYVFVRECTATRLQVVSTPGVHMIVTSGEAFALIPDLEIAAIRKAAQSPERMEPWPYLKAGERVRVVRGPMKGIEGILVRQSGQYRLVLSVELLSRSASVEVGACDTEPLGILPSRGQPAADALWCQAAPPRRLLPEAASLQSANGMRYL